MFFTVLHLFKSFCEIVQFLNQYSYYCDFFCSGPTSRLRDCHCHKWVSCICTVKITASRFVWDCCYVICFDVNMMPMWHDYIFICFIYANLIFPQTFCFEHFGWDLDFFLNKYHAIIVMINAYFCQICNIARWQLWT